ncbi:hypothetical protein [Verrucomicrobium spinosum]|uniref:PBECR3 domain-containing polyvalent protein n=2 Tax=Verrucomicrobium spinosum TaxID=2736 RepID=UPI0001746BC6|nr:hypothetical protein [Verrucomicrobium spinosum]
MHLLYAGPDIKEGVQNSLPALPPVTTGNWQAQDPAVWAREYPTLDLKVKESLDGRGRPSYSLGPLPEGHREEFATFAGNAVGDAQFQGVFEIRAASDAEAAEILKQGGPDVTGMQHEVTALKIRHAFNKHGDAEVEHRMGQRALTAQDIPRLLETLDDPDSIKVTPSTKANRTKVNYSKKFPDGTVVVAERIFESSKRNKPRLSFRTAWVTSPAGVESNTAQVYTPGRQGEGATREGASQATSFSLGPSEGVDTPVEQGRFVLPSRRRSDGLAQSRAQGTGALVAAPEARGALDTIRQHLPALLHQRVLAFDTPADLAASSYGEDYSDAEIASMEGAEALFDRHTKRTLLFLGQVEQRPGETPLAAVGRVLVHERMGHEGVNFLLETDADFAARWNKLMGAIPQAELDAILDEPGYAHLEEQPPELALEWMARQIEAGEAPAVVAQLNGQEPGLAQRMWQAMRDALTRLLSLYSGEAKFDLELNDLIAPGARGGAGRPHRQPAHGRARPARRGAGGTQPPARGDPSCLPP